MPHFEVDAAPVGGGAVAGLIHGPLAGLDGGGETARHGLMGVERLLAPEPSIGGGLAPWQIKRVLKYIDAHLAEHMSVQTVAREVRLGPSYFSRTFRRSFGQPFMRFVACKRIERARRMMVATDFRLCEIALFCGFADQAHFSRVFLYHAGQTPARWRREALCQLASRLRK
jgi:AraC family transcriptional regulator